MQTTMQMDEAGMMQPFNNLQVNGGIVSYMAELPDVSNAEDQADKKYIPCAVAANSVISKNLSDSSYSYGSQLYFSNSYLYGSKIHFEFNDGGAIYISKGELNFDYIRFGANYASNSPFTQGGAIDAHQVSLIISHAEINGNTAYASDYKTYNYTTPTATTYAYGGAIALNHGNIKITEAHIFNNTASADTYAYSTATSARAYSYVYGGAIYMTGGGKMELYNIEFDGNTAIGKTSAICAASASAIANGTVAGGAIYVGGGIQYLVNVDFLGNYGGESGGAIAATGSNNSMSILSATFSENNVGGRVTYKIGDAFNNCSGGAIYVEGKLHLESTTFSKNFVHASAYTSIGFYGSSYDAIAVAYGGALATHGANIDMQAARFIGNSVTAIAEGTGRSLSLAYGGALYLYGGITQLKNTEFETNSADNGGGAIYLCGSATAIYTVTSGNTIKNTGNKASYGGFILLSTDTAITFSVQNTALLIIGETGSTNDSIAGAGSITKNGAGVMTIHSDISGHTGTWNLADGTLQLLSKARYMSLDKWSISNSAKLQLGELGDSITIKTAKSFGSIDLGNGANTLTASATTSISALSAGSGNDTATLDASATIGALDLGTGSNKVIVNKSLTINNFVRLNNGGCTTISINQNAQLGGNSIAVSASGNLSGLTTYNLNWANVANSDSVRILVSNGIKSNVYQFSLELLNGTKNLTLKTDASNTVYFQVKNGSSWQTVTPGLQPTVSRKPAGDIDGNGVSDVMFQYKVDHQIGFWMNGSNTWKGQGLPEPAEWEVVGAYDMNANGKADVVMLGNVTVNGVKGAYVGYRKDGDMSTWENISFLNNPDNIQWNVKVGNMTGNAGKNSIVWHAAELGAVGVWTDGTNNWVSISGGFDKNWTMLGTGDFNGDGKDEILFRNGTNFYTTDINSNFSSLGGFGDGWDVRAIGDFSGDGKDDLVLFHKDTGSVVKLENGQTSSYASLGQLDANDWFIVGAGDYNGDGKDDLLVRQYSSGMLGYYANGDFSKWNEMGRGVDMNWAVIA